MFTAKCSRRLGTLLLSALLVEASLAVAAAAVNDNPPADVPLYNRDVRPILAEHCFACHGPDSAARKADLRLDRREVAVESGAIEPGKPDESQLIADLFQRR